MTELTVGRIVKKAADCLEDSKGAYRLGLYEACVNRAYYTMFHSVQALLFVSGVKTKTHAGAHYKFRELYLKTGFLDSSLNIRIQRTFEKRNFGDYDYDEVAEDEAQESIQDATTFFESVLQYLKENNHLK
jgi:uncharacterized protein (UPF0332 family)